MSKVDKPYSLRWFINKYYKRIKRTCDGLAFKTGWNSEDILSHLNERLAEQVKKDEVDGIALQFLQDEERFMSWVYTIAKNFTINEHRSKRNTAITRHEDILDIADTLHKNKTYQPDVDKKQFANELKIYVNNALAHKSKQWRIVFDTVFYQNKKYHEAADAAKIPIGTVKTIIHVMRDLIKAEFGQRYEYLFNNNEYESN